MYRARLSRPTLRKTECEIVAVKTIKCKDTKSHASMYMTATEWQCPSKPSLIS